MLYIEMSESIYKNNELENEVTLDMSYFWYSDVRRSNRRRRIRRLMNKSDGCTS